MIIRDVSKSLDQLEKVKLIIAWVIPALALVVASLNVRSDLSQTIRLQSTSLQAIYCRSSMGACILFCSPLCATQRSVKSVHSQAVLEISLDHVQQTELYINNMMKTALLL